jgi:hypothetical protein
VTAPVGTGNGTVQVLPDPETTQFPPAALDSAMLVGLTGACAAVGGLPFTETTVIEIEAAFGDTNCETVSEPLFTVNVTVAEPPAELDTVAVQVPAVCGVTTSENVVPEPLGVPKTTMAVGPVPHEPAATEIAFAGSATLLVIVTVCANAAPVPENVTALGAAEI